jgi:hypothetical protein
MVVACKPRVQFEGVILVMLYVICEPFFDGVSRLSGFGRVLGFQVSGYRVVEKLDRLVVMGLRRPP